jgi:endo-1,4-beta-xylanase
MSTVTLRYWYNDQGLGTAVGLDVDYVSNLRVTDGRAVAAPSPVAGADHYVELSFSGALAAKGATSNGDQCSAMIRLHNADYQGTVDVAIDYSYNGGAIGYNDKITLHDKSGKVIWGVAPC